MGNKCNLYPDDEIQYSYQSQRVVEAPVHPSEPKESTLLPLNDEDRILIFPDGSYYRGRVNVDRPEGQGKLVRKDGSSHEGEWKDGYPHGYGTVSYPNGDSYSGFFKKGKRDGKNGKYTTNEFTYIGDWVDGKMHGSGTLTFTNGEEYKGHFENNNSEA